MANCILKLPQQYGVLIEKFGRWTGTDTEFAHSEMKNIAKKIMDCWTAVILHKTAIKKTFVSQNSSNYKL